MRSYTERGGCWIWSGPRTKDGYGVLTIGRKQHRAHRISYETFVGPLTHGLFVCHRCDVADCINPQHLFLGTALDNARDMMAKGRRNPLRGDRHPNSKLSQQDRSALITERMAGATLSSLATKYGISFQQVSHIYRSANAARN